MGTKYNGFMCFKKIYDANHDPVDYILVLMSDNLEVITLLKRKDIVGRRLTAILRTMSKMELDLYEMFIDILFNGLENRRRIIKIFGIDYEISIIDDENNYFIMTFNSYPNIYCQSKLYKKADCSYNNIYSYIK